MEDDQVTSVSSRSPLANCQIMPCVKDLIYWTNPMKSGIVFAALLFGQLCLVLFSLVSVVAYGFLAALIFVSGARFYYAFLAKGAENPINTYLRKESLISRDHAESLGHQGVDYLNAVISHVRQILLIENVVESAKWGIFFYVLTYVGARFNFLTLCILCTITAFSIPKVYQAKQAEIDKLLAVLRQKVMEGMQQVQAKAKAMINRAPAAAKKAD